MRLSDLLQRGRRKKTPRLLSCRPGSSFGGLGNFMDGAGVDLYAPACTLQDFLARGRLSSWRTQRLEESRVGYSNTMFWLFSCGRGLSKGVTAQARENSQTATPSSDSLPFGGPAGHAEALDKLKRKLDVENPELPVGTYGRDDDELLTWFLRDRRYDVSEAAFKLVRMLRWRQEFGVTNVTQESVARIAATGKAYLHDQLDLVGRPVLVVRVARHLPNPEDIEDSQRLCVFLIEKAITMLPSGQENILGIFDLRGFRSRNADLSFIQFIIDVFFYYYPRRLGEVLFVDAPPIFIPIWKVFKPLLRSYADLVRFCSSKELGEQYFSPGTVPKDFATDENSGTISEL
ncbi:hypothetical protein CBR_g39624 [Chara braunii]|uniref:CRAL-TRIO domain-containing protein n=1 Tax=Chara braunii TaxID=69332 RepID=A0A388K1C9_CHABU|nr:hypothetical protein CBR_g39624 [Chara braunii]|eukprot:GBG63839.1 hypothetical protein CBR_g39624 [Chara braunii]